ncbi:MAG: UvrD-helicase domain-containing protein [Parahaliea sp.]
MNIVIADARERAQALDPLHSYCVSAPAGSGKTELLIQRFLALLARVERPEQVLAITFTRKAAAEMRERVLQALRDAATDQCPDGDHQRRTRELAQAVLALDAQREWELLASSARLGIRTIDGFCAALTRQMPVLSTFGAQLGAVDDAGPLYAEAVAELFSMLDSNHPVADDLRALMLHFDNNWERLGTLFQSLLARREQWLVTLGVGAEPAAAERAVQGLVEAVIGEALETLWRRLGPWLGELHELQCFAASQLGEPEPALAGRAAADLSAWRALRLLLLTADGKKWRSRVDKRNGFPAGKGRPAEMKARLQELLATLSADCDELRPALLEAVLLPTPGEDSASWRLVVHLSHVLPVLAAQLLLVFERRRQVDHSQVAQSALQALGPEDEPTDLALRLDYRIEHILVDEFQDTAITQYELLTRLTRGWAEHNEANPERPRTFLIVGDGMQSIYGFRDANVSLFLRARESGFNGVLPRYLELRANFRSEAGVVDWVNSTFSQVFPSQDSSARGEVKFSPAQAVKPPGPAEAVRLQVFSGEQAAATEVEFVCDQITVALAQSPAGSVALLGRSRPQLQPFVSALRRRGIAFAAQDMDRLSHSPVILDLMTLVRALANRADRVAWAALLRGPLCGLTLADLHAFFGAGDDWADLLEYAGYRQVRDQLSTAGAALLERLWRVLQWAESRRDRLSQRVWLELLWLRLGGPASVPAQQNLHDAERFFQLLESAELEGRLLDVPWLEERLARLYVDAADTGARLQVMTLHKAKGLEFDQVFIPALARGTAGDERALLLWDEVGAPGEGGGFLLAADDHSAPGEPGLYNYLASRRRRKRLLENTRLLYVGATRAVRRLVLTATLKDDDNTGELKAPGEHSLLATIWPAVVTALEHQRVAETGEENAPDGKPAFGRLLRQPRLPASAPATAAPAPGETAGRNMPPAAGNRLDRHVGTTIHALLEQLAQRAELPAAPGPEATELGRSLQAHLGLQGEALEQGLQRVLAALATTLADTEAGRWLLRSDHRDSACELPLTRVDEAGVVRDIVIDRCFVDARSGERWVVDYKSSLPAAGEALESFLAVEAARYREQLLGYRAALAALGPEPLRCALYFTGLGRLLSLDVDEPG